MFKINVRMFVIFYIHKELTDSLDIASYIVNQSGNNRTKQGIFNFRYVFLGEGGRVPESRDSIFLLFPAVYQKVNEGRTY